MDIHVYQLEMCGFYGRGDGSPRFGAVSDWWPEFCEWVDKQVGLTNTYSDVKDLPSRVYCVGAFEDGRGNLGATLWNEAPSYMQGVAYLESAKLVGEAAAKTTRLPPDTIPGWPTYIWFIPDRGLIVSLSPDDFGAAQSSGMRQTRKYFGNYLQHHSGYLHVKRTVTDDGEVKDNRLGYSDYGDSTPDPEVEPYFLTTPLRGNGPLDVIRERREDIHKIVKNYSIDTLLPDQRSMFNRMTRPLVNNPVTNTFLDNQQARGEGEVDRRTVRVEYSHTPTSEELELEIQEWEKKDFADNYSVGVYFSGDTQIRRFDRPMRKLKVEAATNRQTPQLNEQELKDTWSKAIPIIESSLSSSG